MNNPPSTRTHARLRAWLTTGYALFIGYASLSPFSGWRNQGLAWDAVLGMPFGMTYTAFDALANLLSYLPLGFLVALTSRARLGVAASVITGLCAGLLLSAGMEYLQMYLPTRISSNMDMLSNGTGALIGALLGVVITSRPGLFALLTGWRNELFRDGVAVDFGLALLALWVFGQINPSLPMLGHVFISKVAQQPFVVLPPAPFNWGESAAVMLNLLMLGTLLLTLLRTPRNYATILLAVLSGVALAKFIAAAVLLKSWALLLWINSEAVLGMVLGMAMLLAMLPLPRGAVLVAGALAATGHVVLVNFVLDSSTPSVSASVYHWHYGHLLNYNGLAQTISLIFPLLLIFHLWRIRKV
ncbi:MAG TPA: VanZ family protein [Gallionella sp.]